MRGNKRRAYTFTELTMTVMIVGIVVAASLPDGAEKKQDEINVLAKQFASDAAYARSYSAANPDDPMVIKFDLFNNRYWLARKSAPDTCVTHPVSDRSFLRSFQAGAETGFDDIQIIGADVGTNNVLEFDPRGQIKLDRDAVITVRAGGEDYEVSVSAAAVDVKLKKKAYAVSDQHG